LTGAVAAVIALAGTTAGASAHRTSKLLVAGQTPVAPGARYLALGDSVTFGYMEPSVVPAPNYLKPASFHAYPEQLGQALHLKVANAACPGETSSSLINPKAQSNGCENAVGGGGFYRQHFPLHANYQGSQLAFGLKYLRAHKNVSLVSLMIGANDSFVCIETTKDACASAAEQKALFAKIGSNVKKILSAVRKQADYVGQLAIVNYYSLNYSSPATNAMSLKLNKAVDTAAKPFGVVFADGYGQFAAASAHSGRNPCTAGLLTQLGAPGKCGVHPSYAGQTLLAASLQNVIKLMK
jgi:lysophospholipase L1-like esterase